MTPKQKEIFVVIDEWWKRFGFGPTIDDVMRQTGDRGRGMLPGSLSVWLRWVRVSRTRTWLGVSGPLIYGGGSWSERLPNPLIGNRTIGSAIYGEVMNDKQFDLWWKMNKPEDIPIDCYHRIKEACRAAWEVATDEENYRCGLIAELYVFAPMIGKQIAGLIYRGKDA